jgi:hypothetical protein
MVAVFGVHGFDSVESAVIACEHNAMQSSGVVLLSKMRRKNGIEL